MQSCQNCGLDGMRDCLSALLPYLYASANLLHEASVHKSSAASCAVFIP